MCGFWGWITEKFFGFLNLFIFEKITCILVIYTVIVFFFYIKNKSSKHSSMLRIFEKWKSSNNGDLLSFFKFINKCVNEMIVCRVVFWFWVDLIRLNSCQIVIFYMWHSASSEKFNFLFFKFKLKECFSSGAQNSPLRQLKWIFMDNSGKLIFHVNTHSKLW